MQSAFEVSLDEQRQILRQRFTGEIDADGFRQGHEKTLSLAEQLRDPNRVRILVDARAGGGSTAGARREMLGALQQAPLERMAVYGAHPLGRVMLRFLSVVSGTRKTRTFTDEEQALAWLLE